MVRVQSSNTLRRPFVKRHGTSRCPKISARQMIKAVAYFILPSMFLLQSFFMISRGRGGPDLMKIISAAANGEASGRFSSEMNMEEPLPTGKVNSNTTSRKPVSSNDEKRHKKTPLNLKAQHVITDEKPKAYIHIGAPKTGTTSIQNTMAMDKNILQQDKYFLALHGQVTEKGKPNDYIIDNMLVLCDRLGACVWSDEERQLITKGSGNSKAGSCPEHLLPAFDRFLSNAIAAKSNVVISNEWLIRPTSETGLLKILNGWDPTIVIYYRRFFDWMISAHYQWHFDIGMSTLESLQGRVRRVDFIRRICSALFASNVAHSPDDDANLGFVDLIDIPEYTYHVWKRYKNVPEYGEDNIKIVNYHDGHIVKSFYCDVLGAERACKLETERLESGESVKSRLKASTAYVDLAMGLYWKDKDLLMRMSGEGRGENITMATFNEWGDKFKERMTAKGLVEDDLPKECLTKSEQTLFLNVSLAYEKILRTDLYNSGGKEAAMEHFAKTLAKDEFCSVDLEGVLGNPKWAFLFEQGLRKELLPSLEDEADIE